MTVENSYSLFLYILYNSLHTSEVASGLMLPHSDLYHHCLLLRTVWNVCGILQDGATPLFKAAHKGHLEVVLELLPFKPCLGLLKVTCPCQHWWFFNPFIHYYIFCLTFCFCSYILFSSVSYGKCFAFHLDCTSLNQIPILIKLFIPSPLLSCPNIFVHYYKPL